MATQTLAPPVPATRRRLRMADSAAYVLVGFPLAVVAFVLLLTGFTLEPAFSSFLRPPLTGLGLAYLVGWPLTRDGFSSRSAFMS